MIATPVNATPTDFASIIASLSEEMPWITLISGIISLVNIAIVVWKWNNSRPRLKFYPVDSYMFFRYSDASEYHYAESKCLVFCKARIANPSSSAVTISHMTLSVNHYPDTHMDFATEIRESYVFKAEPQKVEMPGEKFLTFPLTLPPYGYAEGMLIFPYAPAYKESIVPCLITAVTFRKNFSYTAELHRQESIKSLPYFRTKEHTKPRRMRNIVWEFLLLWHHLPNLSDDTNSDDTDQPTE